MSTLSEPVNQLASVMPHDLESILLVEDDADHARLIMKAFKDHGHLMNKIYWVKNGLDAIAFVSRTGQYKDQDIPRPALILLDINLPLKDGFQVLEELKTSEQYKAIPIVMLTTTRSLDDVEKALKLGANDYIVKPVKFADFIKKVGQLGHYWAFVSNARLSSIEKKESHKQ